MTFFSKVKNQNRKFDVPTASRPTSRGWYFLLRRPMLFITKSSSKSRQEKSQEQIQAKKKKLCQKLQKNSQAYASCRRPFWWRTYRFCARIFFRTAKKPKRKFVKNQQKIYPISTQNRPKLFLGQVFVGLWGVLAGKLATRVDFGRFWNPPNPPDGTVLGPSWSHVGAKSKYFGVESVILEVLKSQVATGIDFRRFLKPWTFPIVNNGSSTSADWS